MTSEIHVLPEYQRLFREVGLDAEGVFKSPEVKVWRKLADRENGTIDSQVDGKNVRLHVKRYVGREMAEKEIAGHRLLEQAGIPTAKLAAWGHAIGNRGFVIFEDLAGYDAADRAIERGVDFENLLEPTAKLAARLHNALLHHRDLYLCHFFVRIGDGVDVKLIDVARVGSLENFLTRKRWVVKDLAQFWYSTLQLPVKDEQRDRWLLLYAKERGIENTAGLRRRVVRKANRIARHDERLRKRQPGRNISIPK